MGCGCSCLDDDESVLLDYPTSTVIRHGPGCIPFWCARPRKVKSMDITTKNIFPMKMTEKNF